MARFFGVVPESVWNLRRPLSRRLIRAGAALMAMAIGCYVWDQFDPRSDQPAIAEIVDCTVVTKVEQPLLKVSVGQKTYLIRPRPGVVDASHCRPGDRINVYHPPGAPTVLHGKRQVPLAAPAFLLSTLGFVLLFAGPYLLTWPIWVSGDWQNAPQSIRWLRRVPVHWLSLLLLGLVYPLAVWIQT